MPSANTPDFDPMTSEEMMAWMESLAKRQGAKEGFTAEANVDIAETPDQIRSRFIFSRQIEWLRDLLVLVRLNSK